MKNTQKQTIYIISVQTSHTVESITDKIVFSLCKLFTW